MGRAVLHIVLGWSLGFFGIWALIAIFRPHTLIDDGFAAMLGCGVLGGLVGLIRWHRKFS